MPSTVIRTFFYDAEARLLTVRFTTGRAYRYAEVPPELVAAFRASPSKGVFFNAHIRDRYDYQELPPSDERKAAG